MNSKLFGGVLSPDLAQRILLHLVFRNADGSLTGFSWYFAAVALFMIGSGIWCLVSPQSYSRLMRSRVFPPPGGRFWSAISTPLWVRVSGATAVVAALGFMTWVVFFSDPGRLY